LSVGTVSSRQQGRKLPRTPESRQALPPSARRRGWRSDALPAFARKSALVNATGFDIARITDASRTKTGMVLGTPSFMSPEQLAGQHIDGRSDRYSLGVMLFQLLTGTLPSRGDSMAALMYRIANQSPPDVRALRPGLPAGIADMLTRSLAKPPAQRYQSGADLAAELKRLRAGIDTLAGTDMPLRDNASNPSGHFETTQVDPNVRQPPGSPPLMLRNM
jgi:serine/threonine-protein kinase